MTDQYKTCGEPCRTIGNRKYKIVRVPPNVSARQDRVIRIAVRRWVSAREAKLSAVNFTSANDRSLTGSLALIDCRAIGLRRHMKHESEHDARDRNRAHEIAGDVARLARALLGKDTEVIWFGSWPQGKARPRSDIDVAVSTGSAISADRMAALRQAVDELPTLYGIDVVDLSATGPILREEILKHGQRL